MLGLRPGTANTMHRNHIRVLSSSNGVDTTVPIERLPCKCESFLKVCIVTGSGCTVKLCLGRTRSNDSSRCIIRTFGATRVGLGGCHPMFVVGCGNVNGSLLDLPLPRILPSFRKLGARLFYTAGDKSLYIKRKGKCSFPCANSAKARDFKVRPGSVSHDLCDGIRRLYVAINNIIERRVVVANFANTMVVPIPKRCSNNRGKCAPVWRT